MPSRAKPSANSSKLDQVVAEAAETGRSGKKAIGSGR